MKVIAKMQSNDGKSEPVEKAWTLPNAGDLDVVEAVVQLLQHAKDQAPWAPRILEIKVEL